jgi:hypothetical protein
VAERGAVFWAGGFEVAVRVAQAMSVGPNFEIIGFLSNGFVLPKCGAAASTVKPLSGFNAPGGDARQRCGMEDGRPTAMLRESRRLSRGVRRTGV